VEVHRLGVFDNRVLRKVFGPEDAGGEAIGGWRKCIMRSAMISK